MPPSDNYRTQVELLIRCLPAVDRVPYFALKGGTAINLFYQNMPRVSVDIDLTFLPVTDRETALEKIRSGLTTVAENIRRTISRAQVQLHSDTLKLLVSVRGAQVKVEIGTIVRGTLLTPVESNLCSAAQQQYKLFVRVRRLATADLYGSKLCVALDRQHPRDLFDVMRLQTEGKIPDEIRHAFVVYLAGHNRPIAELLAPNRKPLEDLFTQHFSGMTDQPIELCELEAARVQLFDWAATALSENERKFLLSVKQGEPDWTQLPFESLDQLPAIQWKLHNIRQMSVRAHDVALARLRDVLEI